MHQIHTKIDKKKTKVQIFENFIQFLFIFLKTHVAFLFSVHISYGKKIYESNGFFYKNCQEIIYIKALGFHP